MRKCRFCGVEIPKRVNRPQIPDERVQNAGFCSIAHLVEHENKKKRSRIEKAERKAHREKLAKVRQGTKKDRSLGHAQNAVNRYIRLRDAGKPCISCGESLPLDISEFDAGHYRSRAAAPELRFDDRNVHGEHAECNRGARNSYSKIRMSETKQQAYEKNLRQRLGDNVVEWLNGPHEPKRYRREELLYLGKVYRRLCKWLERQQ